MAADGRHRTSVFHVTPFRFLAGQPESPEFFARRTRPNRLDAEGTNEAGARRIRRLRTDGRRAANEPETVSTAAGMRGRADAARALRGPESRSATPIASISVRGGERTVILKIPAATGGSRHLSPDDGVLVSGSPDEIPIGAGERRLRQGTMLVADEMTAPRAHTAQRRYRARLTSFGWVRPQGAHRRHGGRAAPVAGPPRRRLTNKLALMTRQTPILQRSERRWSTPVTISRVALLSCAGSLYVRRSVSASGAPLDWLRGCRLTDCRDLI